MAIARTNHEVTGNPGRWARICGLALALVLFGVAGNALAHDFGIVPANNAGEARRGTFVAADKRKKPTIEELGDLVSQRRDVRPFINILNRIQQRTKTRQLDGVANINIMEWTTRKGEAPKMEGVLIYLKDMRGAYDLISDGAMQFIMYPPRDWSYYGELEEMARRFARNNINVVNFFLARLYVWFAAHRKFIGKQGGIIAFYGPADGAELVMFSDKNRRRENNVSSFLSDLPSLKKVVLSERVFVVEAGRRDFQELVLEKQGGSIGIEKPYILHSVR
jgi:hypothetical protein